MMDVADPEIDLPFLLLQGDPDECELNALKVKIKRSEKVYGVSFVRKIKSKSPFLPPSPIKAVRDALKGRRSAVWTAAKTWWRDL